jgi:hypothetical protein
MKDFISKYGGILIGSVYGLTMRVFFGEDLKGFSMADLFSVTFVWIVPIIIGITPLIFASKEQLTKNIYRLGTPILTVFLFFLYCFITRLEDIICLVIISIPFLISAALGGFIFSQIILKYRRRNGIMFSLLFVPFLSGSIEEQLPTPTKVYEVKTGVIINSTLNNVWENIVRVKQINESEYNKGFFNFAGIPRPLYAELDKDTIGATRIGYFEGGLIFKEKVINWNRNKNVSFDITVIPSSIRKNIFDQHILKGGHFKFLNATYDLRHISKNKTELILTSSYQLDTKINIYGSYWGDKLLTDFQERLLEVIKGRCDR